MAELQDRETRLDVGNYVAQSQAHPITGPATIRVGVRTIDLYTVGKQTRKIDA